MDEKRQPSNDGEAPPGRRRVGDEEADARVRGIFLHELGRSLAELGSSAELAIVTAQRTLLELDEDSSTRCVAEAELQRQAEAVREARRAAGAVMQSACVIWGPAPMRLEPTLSDLVSIVMAEAAELQRRTSVRWECASVAPLQVVCDSGLMAFAARTVLTTACEVALAMDRGTQPQIKLRFDVTPSMAELKVRVPIAWSPLGRARSTCEHLLVHPIPGHWPSVRTLAVDRVLEGHGGGLSMERIGGALAITARVSRYLEPG